MNQQQYLLGKLAEEAAEIAQVALKAQQFGMNSTHPDDLTMPNHALLVGEINDLLGVVTMLGLAPATMPDNDAQRRKIDKVESYYHRYEALHRNLHGASPQTMAECDCPQPHICQDSGCAAEQGRL